MENLATEILQELKQNARRWFIAFIITLLLWFGTIGLFIWYITLPVEEYSTEITQESTDRSFNNIGGNVYGGKTNSEENLQEEGD